ncbi:MAG: hypothetical protein Fur0010_25730 [Bdellovibrio sp.]
MRFKHIEQSDFAFFAVHADDFGLKPGQNAGLSFEAAFAARAVGNVEEANFKSVECTCFHPPHPSKKLKHS